MRIRSTAMEALVEEGRAGADTLDEVVANLDDYLATTQFGTDCETLYSGDSDFEGLEEIETKIV